MRLDRDFSEFIECCVDHEVRFLIIGTQDLADLEVLEGDDRPDRTG